MKNSILVLAIAIVTVFSQVAVFGEDKEFLTDGTINPGDVWDNVTIYDTPPDFTVVGMSGGQVENLTIGTYSTLNIDWGMVSYLTATDTSFVNIYDAIVGQLNSHENSRITVNGGDFLGVTINENSRLRFNDGYIQNLDVFTNRATYISGGQIENLYADNWENYQQVFYVSGGRIDNLHSESSWNGKIFNISGGQIDVNGYEPDSICQGNNIFNISGGDVWRLNGKDQMVINVTGGRIDEQLSMSGYSILNISHTYPNYWQQNLSGYENSTLNITGGEFEYVDVHDSSTLKFSDGYIEHLDISTDKATFISGGRIDNIYSQNNYEAQVFNISGGQINVAGYEWSYDGICQGNNVFNISGGEVWGLEGRDQMVINVTGGRIDEQLDMSGYSILNISYTHPYSWQMISGCENSTLNISGGEFENVNVLDNGTLKFSSGYIHDLSINRNWEDYGQATFISGGRIDNIRSYNNGSQVFNISGGQINVSGYGSDSICQGSNIFNISGGEVWGLRGSDQMVINVTGGRIDDWLDMGGYSILNMAYTDPYSWQCISGYEHSTINITSGSYSDIMLTDDSLLRLRNGLINSLIAGGNSYAILEGGTVNDLLVKEMAAVELYEGAIIGNILAQDDGIIKIYGYNFLYDESGGTYGGGQLLGFWLDGRELMIDFADAQNDSTYYNHVILIPEPVTLLLLGLGVVMVRGRKT